MTRITNKDFGVGDIVVHGIFGSTLPKDERITLVEDKDSDINNRMPGFGGKCLFEGGNQFTEDSFGFRGGVWGYTTSIKRVIKKGSAGFDEIMERYKG